MGLRKKNNRIGAKATLSYVMAGLCLVLIIGNVAAFLMLPNMAAKLAILLSNSITVLLMLLAIRPLNAIIQKEFEKKAEELAGKVREQEQMQERITALESENRELTSRLDTVTQTTVLPAAPYGGSWYVPLTGKGQTLVIKVPDEVCLTWVTFGELVPSVEGNPWEQEDLEEKTE